MSKTIEAIYEGGVFKPISPVELVEGTRVMINLLGKETASKTRENTLQTSTPAGSPADLISFIAAIPLDQSGEQFDADEHDRVLYGGQKE